MNGRDDPLHDDQSLVARIAAGDVCALEMLYARHWNSIRRHCRSLVCDQASVEDLSQEILLAVWNSAIRYAGTASVRTWLLRIAHFQAHNMTRRDKLPMAGEPPSEMLATSEPGPEDAVIAATGCAEIARAFRSLSLIHREVLSLVVDQELHYREVADVLGIPIGTVKSRLKNAKEALATALNGKEAAS
jgi:RNA polymerase sigma-70 factor (ECF subfamily)